VRWDIGRATKIRLLQGLCSTLSPVRWAFLALLMVGPAWAEGVDDPAPVDSSANPAATSLTRGPELLSAVEPTLPAELAGVEARVVLRLTVGADGLVGEALTVNATDPRFVAPSLLAALDFVFIPAEVDGQAVVVEVDYTFEFEAIAAPTATLSGRVLDGRSGQPLSGATVSLSGQEVEAVTGADGAFALPDLSGGAATVVVFHPDFERSVQEVELVVGEALSVEAALLPSLTNETVIRQRRPWREVERAPLPNDTSALSGRWTLTKRDLELAPGAMGDVAKVVAQLPGVTADSDMFSLFYVRGGAPDETGFYLDGIELLNPNHLGGTFTMFNPKLVESVDLFAGSVPAWVGGHLAGALAVNYFDGDASEFDGQLDVNLAMGSVHLSGPLGKPGRTKASFVISARRSWFEAYLGLLKLVGVLGTEFAGMAFGEYSGRVTVGDAATPHLVRVHVLHGHDHLTINSDDDSEALLKLGDGVANRANTTMGSVSWRWRIAPAVTWNALAYVTFDHEERQQAADFEVNRRVDTWRPGARASLDVEVQAGHVVRVGVDGAAFSTAGTGAIKDPRVAPPWAGLPWGRFEARGIQFDPSREWAEVSAFVEDEWNRVGGLPLNLRTALRLQVLGPTDEVLPNPRFGLSVPLPTGTTFKGGVGLSHQARRDPLLYDAGVGNPDLQAERAFEVAGGVTQLLPFGLLIRVEGYHKWLDRLVVWPDSLDALAAGETYTNDGSGTVGGADVLLGFRHPDFGLGASYSLQRGERTNPLHTAGPKTYAPAWDTRHSLRMQGEVKFGKLRRWRVAALWELRSGRPRTPVNRRFDGTEWLATPYAYGSESFGPWTELSLRLENWLPTPDGKAKIAWYMDVLNATFAQGDFIWIYGADGEAADGTPEPPRPFVFKQLPIRPWWGMRVEF